MSRKSHMKGNGKLLRIDKNFSHLKPSQVAKINEWMRLAYNAFRDERDRSPRKTEIDRIADTVYDQIQEAEIWIPYGEVLKHFRSKLVRFGNKYEKRKSNSILDIGNDD